MFVDDEQLLNPALVKDSPRFFLAGPDRDFRKLLACHQLRDRLLRVFGETHVAVGDDSDELAGLFNDRDSADPVGLHQLERFGEGLFGAHGDRVDHHSAFKPLDRAYRRRLFLDRKVAVKDSDSAQLSQRNRHVCLGDRVHGRGEDWNVQRDVAGKPGFRFRLAWQDGGF